MKKSSKASREGRYFLKIKKSKCFQNKLRWKSKTAVAIEIVKTSISMTRETILELFLLLLFSSRMKTNSRNCTLAPAIASVRSWIVVIFTWIWNLRMFNPEDRLFCIIQINNNKITIIIKRKMRNIIKNNSNIHTLKGLHRSMCLWIYRKV